MLVKRARDRGLVARRRARRQPNRFGAYRAHGNPVRPRRRQAAPVVGAVGAARDRAARAAKGEQVAHAARGDGAEGAQTEEVGVGRVGDHAGQ